MVQSLKAAGAAIAAWALTGWWLEAPMALLAPWTALVLVASTVYRSVHSGVQQFAVIVVGTLWASAALAVTGNSTLGAMALTLPPLVLIGTYRRLGDQGIYGATTALFVITYGASTAGAVGHRLLETLIGAVVGVAVNAFVLPPVHLRSVRENLHALVHHSGELLASVAEGLRAEDGLSDAAEWHDRAWRLGGTVRALADARRWTSESYRFNPGWRMRRNGPALPRPKRTRPGSGSAVISSPSPAPLRARPATSRAWWPPPPRTWPAVPKCWGGRRPCAAWTRRCWRRPDGPPPHRSRTGGTPP
ncbi:FUSC family protein [Streptomyces sp. INA 01156]